MKGSTVGQLARPTYPFPLLQSAHPKISPSINTQTPGRIHHFFPHLAVHSKTVTWKYHILHLVLAYCHSKGGGLLSLVLGLSMSSRTTNGSDGSKAVHDHPDQLRRVVVRLQQCPEKKKFTNCPPATSPAAALSTATADFSPRVGWRGLTAPAWKPCFYHE